MNGSETAYLPASGSRVPAPRLLPSRGRPGPSDGSPCSFLRRSPSFCRVANRCDLLEGSVRPLIARNHRVSCTRGEVTETCGRVCQALTPVTDLS